MNIGTPARYSKLARISSVAALTLAALPSGAAFAATTQAPASAAAAAAAAAPTAALPASLPFADSAFEIVWTRNDQLVASKAITRGWTWGPAPSTAGYEAYADAPDGSGLRLVQYFDKARMEINNPKGNPSANGYVTNGLLTVELISGQMQVGNSKFVNRQPANIDLASDPDDAGAPTYASFGTVSNTSAGSKRQPDKSKGGAASQRIDRSGNVKDDASKASLTETKIVYYDNTTGHNVPKVFWDYLNSTGPVRSGVGTANKPLLDPWVFAMGLPISDAYWATVRIGGKSQDVLIQAFERRVLTYSPEQPAQWRVQMGNIGQHYYQWRYGNGAGPEKLTNGRPSIPVYLSIPALGENNINVEQVGVDKQNNMDIPKDPNNAAWFKPGTIPGNVGNSVMDGHLNWYGIPQGIFFNLSKLHIGDRLYVRDDRGRDRAFIVTGATNCPYNKCPLMDIFGPSTKTRLNLITCDGTFNRNTQNYSNRFVIYSELATQ